MILQDFALFCEGEQAGIPMLRALLISGRVGIDENSLVMHPRYLKQQMRTIWRLPWWFHVEERIFTEMNKSGVLSSVNIVHGMRYAR